MWVRNFGLMIWKLFCEMLRNENGSLMRENKLNWVRNGLVGEGCCEEFGNWVCMCFGDVMNFKRCGMCFIWRRDSGNNVEMGFEGVFD